LKKGPAKAAFLRELPCSTSGLTLIFEDFATTPYPWGSSSFSFLSLFSERSPWVLFFSNEKRVRIRSVCFGVGVFFNPTTKTPAALAGTIFSFPLLLRIEGNTNLFLLAFPLFSFSFHLAHILVLWGFWGLGQALAGFSGRKSTENRAPVLMFFPRQSVALRVFSVIPYRDFGHP